MIVKVATTRWLATTIYAGEPLRLISRSQKCATGIDLLSQDKNQGYGDVPAWPWHWF